MRMYSDFDLAGAGEPLSCHPTVTVLVENITKDITEEGFGHLLNHISFTGSILHTRFQQRNRENFNKAYVTVSSMDDAKMLVDCLKNNIFIKKLSPKIVEEERVKKAPVVNSYPRSKNVDMEVSLNPLEKQKPEEVFSFNKPFHSGGQVSESSQEPSQSRKVSGVTRSGDVPTNDVRREELQLNLPCSVDDETFKSKFLEKTKKKSLEEVMGLLALSGGGADAEKAGDQTFSSEDSEPPFYRQDDEDWERAEGDPVKSLGIKPTTTRTDPVTPHSLGIKPTTTRTDPVTPHSLGIKPTTTRTDPVTPQSLGIKPTTTRKDQSGNAKGGDDEPSVISQLDIRKDADVYRNYSSFNEAKDEEIDLAEESLRDIVDQKLPKDWTEVEISEISGSSQMKGLPIFIVCSTMDESVYDVTLDPQVFELDSPWSSTVIKEVMENFQGKMLARRIGWIAEEDLNVVEMKREEDDLSIGSMLCRQSLLRRKNYDDLPVENLESSNNEYETPNTSPDKLTVELILQDGSLVYWKGFGKTSNFGKLFINDKDRELLQEVMKTTDPTKTASPQSGQIVATTFEDGLYHRVEIIDLSERRQLALCSLIDDHGNRKVSFQDLHPLPPAAWNIPRLCPELQLLGVPLMPRNEAKEKLRPFNELLKKDEFILRVRNVKEKVVELHGKDGDSLNKIITEILEGEHDDKKPGEEETSKAKVHEESRSVSDCRVPKGGKEITSKSGLQKRQPEMGGFGWIGGEDSLDVEKFTSYRTLSLGSEISVRVLYSSSSTSFFVCSEAEYILLEKFQVNLQNLVDISITVPMTSEHLAVGDLVLFKLGLDWYRAIITKLRDDKAKVFSPDWGWSSKMVRVSQDNFQPIVKEEVRRTKFWASPCSQDQGKGGVQGEGDVMKVSVIRVEGLKYILETI